MKGTGLWNSVVFLQLNRNNEVRKLLRLKYFGVFVLRKQNNYCL